MLGLENRKGQTLFIQHDHGYSLTADRQGLFDATAWIEAQMNAAVEPRLKKRYHLSISLPDREQRSGCLGVSSN